MLSLHHTNLWGVALGEYSARHFGLRNKDKRKRSLSKGKSFLRTHEDIFVHCVSSPGPGMLFFTKVFISDRRD